MKPASGVAVGGTAEAVPFPVCSCQQSFRAKAKGSGRGRPLYTGAGDGSPSLSRNATTGAEARIGCCLLYAALEAPLFHGCVRAGAWGSRFLLVRFARVSE